MIAFHQLIPTPRSFALSASHSNQLHPAQLSQTTLNRLRRWERFTKLSSLTPRYLVSQRPQPDHASPIKSRKRYATTHLLELTVGATPVQFPTHPARQRHPRHPRLAVDRPLNVRDGLFRKRLPTNDHVGKIAFSVPRVQSKRCVAQLVYQRGEGEICVRIANGITSKTSSNHMSRTVRDSTLAIASLAGMTSEMLHEFRRHSHQKLS